MANLIERMGVVLQLEAIASHFPGGMAGFREWFSWNESCQDGELLTFLFANLEEANVCAFALEESGFVHYRGGKANDFVIVDQVRGPQFPTDWLNFGEASSGGRAIRVVWKTNEESIDVPEGWVYQGSPSECLATGRDLPAGPTFPRIAIVKRDGRPVLVDPLTAMIPEIDAILRDVEELKGHRPWPAGQIERLHDRLREEYLPRLVHECNGPESNDKTAHCLLGMVHTELGQSAEALRAYQVVERLATGDATVLKVIAERALAIEDTFELVRAARRLTEVNPQNPCGWAYLAEGLSRSGQAMDAVRAINRAIELDPLSIIFQAMKDRIDPQDQV